MVPHNLVVANHYQHVRFALPTVPGTISGQLFGHPTVHDRHTVALTRHRDVQFYTYSSYFFRYLPFLLSQVIHRH
jgi:hypothetical protein